MAYKEGTKVQTPVWLDPKQVQKLNQLARRIHVPKQQYRREAVDDLLWKYQKEAGR